MLAHTQRYTRFVVLKSHASGVDIKHEALWSYERIQYLVYLPVHTCVLVWLALHEVVRSGAS